MVLAGLSFQILPTPHESFILTQLSLSFCSSLLFTKSSLCVLQ